MKLTGKHSCYKNSHDNAKYNKQYISWNSKHKYARNLYAYNMTCIRIHTCVCKYDLESNKTVCFRLLCHVSLMISMSTIVFRASLRFSIYCYNGYSTVIYEYMYIIIIIIIVLLLFYFYYFLFLSSKFMGVG